MAEKKTNKEENTAPEEQEYTVRLPKVRGEDAKFVGIDGVAYLVKRGENVRVPKAVYDELMRAEAAEIRADEQVEALAVKKQIVG